MTTPALLAERGFSLRWLHAGDLPWLRDLYASTRAEEMAPVPWPDATKRAFLDQQFSLQHQHFLTHYGDAEFLAIEHAQFGRVGRYYLQCNAPEHLIVDICLFPNMRGQGVGEALIRHSQQHAQSLGHGMYLHVHAANPRARWLYERLGFIVTGIENAYQRMRWAPPPA